MQEKHKILIVDDVASNIQALAAVLKDDYQLRVATTGKRALELVSNEPDIDLILLDIEMPEMSGFEVISELKANYDTADIPVIFVTGNITIEDEEKGLIAGAVDYIAKPIRPVIVQARVKTHITLKNQRDQLKYEAVHDKLTGLYNRYQLDNEGYRKFKRALRQKSNFTVIMIDIDHFKNVNDSYGHIIGDEVLKSIANLLKTNRRVEDFVVRYGGEEFLMLLEECSAEDAYTIAETLRKEVALLNPAGVEVSASFGIASLRSDHVSMDRLLKDADDALYEAKGSGRNKVTVYTPKD